MDTAKFERVEVFDGELTTIETHLRINLDPIDNSYWACKLEAAQRWALDPAIPNARIRVSVDDVLVPPVYVVKIDR